MLHVNTRGFTEWQTAYISHVVLILSNHLSLSTRIMLLMLHRCKTCYIKSNIVKHIALNCFIPINSWRVGNKHLAIKIMRYLADLFRESLPIITFQKWFMGLVCDGFGICKSQGEYLPELFLFKASYYTLFPFMSLLFRFSSRFLMR